VTNTGNGVNNCDAEGRVRLNTNEAFKELLKKTLHKSRQKLNNLKLNNPIID
jgi:hypothetical protein